MDDKKQSRPDAAFADPVQQPEIIGDRSTATRQDVSDGAVPAASPAQTNFVGRTLGQYEIVALVGQGGMGTVYKAKQVITGKIVALKIVHPHLCANETTTMRFQQEARAAGSLSHPNTTSVHHFDITSDGVPFFCMDFVEGRSLAELIEAEGALAAERVNPLFIQVCAGLQHAHNKGLVHRDIKPSNILITRDDQNNELVKIVDFGIAKILDTEGVGFQTITETGSVMGSPAYMSPEQCRGARVDSRSDIYSLGCVMYEALTGTPPHVGANPLDTIFKHLNETPKAMNQAGIHGSITANLETIVSNALQKNPANRYQKVQDLANDLQGLPGGHQPKRLVARTSSWQRRLIACALGIAILAGAGTIYGAGTDPYTYIDTSRQVAWTEPLPAHTSVSPAITEQVGRLCNNADSILLKKDKKEAVKLLPSIVDLSESAFDAGDYGPALDGFERADRLKNLSEEKVSADAMSAEITAGKGATNYMLARLTQKERYQKAEEQLTEGLHNWEKFRATMNQTQQKHFFRDEQAYCNMFWDLQAWSKGLVAFRHMFQDLQMPNSVLEWVNTPITEAKYADCMRLSEHDNDTMTLGFYDRLKDKFSDPVDKAFCHFHLAQLKLALSTPDSAGADEEFRAAIDLLKNAPDGEWADYYKAYITARYADFLWQEGRYPEAILKRLSAAGSLNQKDLYTTRFPLAKR